MTHLEEGLLALVGSQVAVPDEDHATHLRDCDRCSSAVRSYRALCRGLTLPESWAVASDSGTIDFRRRLDRLNTEQLSAQGRDPATLDDATESDLQRLIGLAHAMLHRSPSEALLLAERATIVATSLDAGVSSDSIAELRGLAARERANALRYLGRYREALQALAEAKEHFESQLVGDPNLAGVAYVSAAILQEMDRFGEALDAARASAAVFKRFGDERRFAHATLLEAAIRYQTGETEDAKSVFLSLIPIFAGLDDRSTLAGVYGNVAACELRLARYAEGAQYLQQSIAAYDELDMPTERLRSRWLLARIIRAKGDLDEAIRRFREVKLELQERGMQLDAALVALDLAEALLESDAGYASEVMHLCRDASARFAENEMSGSVASALSLLREAMRHGELTPEILRSSRERLEGGIPLRPSM